MPDLQKNTIDVFIENFERELAREKWASAALTATTFSVSAEEAAESVLGIRNNLSNDRFETYLKLVKVASMACCLAIEGEEPISEFSKNKRLGCGCNLPVRRPHA